MHKTNVVITKENRDQTNPVNSPRQTISFHSQSKASNKVKAITNKEEHSGLHHTHLRSILTRYIAHR